MLRPQRLGPSLSDCGLLLRSNPFLDRLALSLYSSSLSCLSLLDFFLKALLKLLHMKLIDLAFFSSSRLLLPSECFDETGVFPTRLSDSLLLDCH